MEEALDLSFDRLQMMMMIYIFLAKYPNIKFNDSLFSGSRAVPSERTDRHDGASRRIINSAKASKQRRT